MTEIIRMENGISVLDARASGKIAEFERQLKAIKEQEEELKRAILEEMESKGIIKVEDEINDISITYVAESYRETFDSKLFKKTYPDVYDEFIKMSPVKPSIRIKVKG
jgi:hypothetical protein